MQFFYSSPGVRVLTWALQEKVNLQVVDRATKYNTILKIYH